MNLNNENNELFNSSCDLDIETDQQTHQIQSNGVYTIPEPEPDLIQSQQQHKQKRRSHGNRKLQRYRRKLRKQGMDSKAIGEVISSTWIHTTGSSVFDQITQEKEETSITSLKIIVKNKDKKKKQRKINKKQIIVKEKNQNSSEPVWEKKVKVPPIINDSVDYTKVPDEVFYQMTCTVFNQFEKLNYMFNENDKIEFIRHYTSLIDRLSYVQLQQLQWIYYHHVGITQNIWKGRVLKYVAEKYSIYHTYGRSKNLIEQRLQQIEKHLQHAQNAIEKFEQEIVSKYEHSDDCRSIMKELSSIIHQFVEEKQLQLRHQYEYKREILILDAADHQLLQKFFSLEPNKSHVKLHSMTRCILFETLHNFNLF